MIVTVSSFLMETGAVLFAMSCLTLLSCRFFRFGIINMLAADACFGLAMVFPRRVIEFLGTESPVLSFIEHDQIRPSFVAVAMYALISAVLYMVCYSWRSPHRHAAVPASAAPAPAAAATADAPDGSVPAAAPDAAAPAAAAVPPVPEAAPEPAAPHEQTEKQQEVPVSWTAGSQEDKDDPEVPDVLLGLRAIDAPAAGSGADMLEAGPAAGGAAELADKG